MQNNRILIDAKTNVSALNKFIRVPNCCSRATYQPDNTSRSQINSLKIHFFNRRCAGLVGEFIELVADNPEEKIELKAFHCEIQNDHEALKKEIAAYVESQMALHKITTIGGGDKFILWTNRVSNDHGLSIRKPFIWFLRITIPAYLLYLWCAGLLFQPTKIDPDLIGYYFSFIDLTHKIDFLKEKNGDLNALSLTLDYVNKLFVGYLIFQFVVAFRKYGKKS